MNSHPEKPQFLRRDFLVGAAAGFVVTQTSGSIRGDQPRFPEGATRSYAQSGEDTIVQELFDFLKIQRPTYLDVGAFRPIAYNNTYLFYQGGSRGVLVEPNMDLIPSLKAVRPGDTVLNLGIGVAGQTAASYYCLTLPEWNTFDGDEAERMASRSGGKVKVEKVVAMPLVPINQVIAEHFGGKAPDYLSIDVESLDLPILKTLDFERFRPRVICTETLVPLTARMAPETSAFLAGHGYIPRAQTFANSIFLDERLLG